LTPRAACRNEGQRPTCSSSPARDATAAGIGDAFILEWVHLADLCRIKGVGSEYSGLPEAAGIDTVVDLSKRVAEHLHSKMLRVNQAKNLLNKMPGLKQIRRWIQQARRLPGVVTY
jgi:hypothetical protein